MNDLYYKGYHIDSQQDLLTNRFYNGPVYERDKLSTYLFRKEKRIISYDVPVDFCIGNENTFNVCLFAKVDSKNNNIFCRLYIADDDDDQYFDFDAFFPLDQKDFVIEKLNSIWRRIPSIIDSEFINLFEFCGEFKRYK